MTKPTKNILDTWSTYQQQPDMRIRGKVQVDQPDIHVKAGDFIITSKVCGLHTDKTGRLICETANSIYILVNS